MTEGLRFLSLSLNKTLSTHQCCCKDCTESRRISHSPEGSTALRDACLRGKDTPRRDDIRVLSLASRSSLVPRVELPGLQRCPTPGTGASCGSVGVFTGTCARLGGRVLPAGS